MEDFLYAYNQPKKFGKYDLFLDGKITANEIVYKVLTEDNDIENINLADKVKELESRLQTHFTFETVTELPTEGKETVIYLVANDEESGDKDSYNEYMWVKGKGFELIGSGTYAQQKADLQAEIDRASAAETVLTDNLAKEVTDRTDADTALNTKIEAETERATEAEKVLTDNFAQEVTDRTDADTALDEKIDKEIEDRTDADTLIRETVTSITGYPFEKITGDTLSINDELAKRVPYTLHKNVDVVGNIKDVVKLDVPESSKEAMYCPQGLIMGGSAQEAGLVTRGICGINMGGTNVTNDGSCTKDNLYINYDGTNTYASRRQLVIQAGEIGEHYGHNLYQYAAARGDAVKGYVDEKIENRVVINEPITITEGDNTTSITSDTISTTTLTGTLDAESMKNSLTAGAILNVMPMSWSSPSNKANTNPNQSSIAIGNNANALNYYGYSFGAFATAGQGSVALGYNSETKTHCVSIGYKAKAKSQNLGITIGAEFTENTDSSNVEHYCKTEGTGSITIGAGANTLNTTITDSEGNETTVESSNAITIGCKASNMRADSVVIGAAARIDRGDFPSVAIGSRAICAGTGNNVAIGNLSVSSGLDTNVGHNARVYGGNCVGVGANVSNDICTKSVVIGSAAKITSTTAADGTVTKSENTTVIGAGALATAPNAVVLGAGASTAGNGTIVIGAGTSLSAGTGNIANAILIGKGAKSSGEWASGSIALGANSTVLGDAAYAIGGGSEATTGGIAIGTGAKSGYYANSIGISCVNKNNGTTSFRQQKSNGETYTQFYIMAAESELAVQYEDGEACMGYVVKNKTTGELVAAGTQKLSVLFPNNSTFQPATIDENGEWVMPKVFHPSDLDLPIEEPSENNDVQINIPTIEEEYKPLPIYPIVETPIEEEYKPLPVYPTVEPTIEEEYKPLPIYPIVETTIDEITE